MGGYHSNASPVVFKTRELIQLVLNIEMETFINIQKYSSSKEYISCHFSDPNSRLHRAQCSVPDKLICLGNRNFLKLRPCNWTGGYKWTTALALSITLGGFGADRYINLTTPLR